MDIEDDVEWRYIPGSSIYQVSNYGTIRRLEYSKTITNRKTGTSYIRTFPLIDIKLSYDKNGYHRIKLQLDDGKVRYYRVCRLVAEVFLSDWDKDLQVNHINGVHNDDRVCNLEMCTCKENVYHFYHSPLMEHKREQFRLKHSIHSKKVQLDPEVRTRESENQHNCKHVLCIQDDLAFSSRRLCCRYYHVDYSVIVNRCDKYPDKVTKLTLKSKDFRYMTEEEYKYYKVHKSDKVISYVRL